MIGTTPSAWRSTDTAVDVGDTISLVYQAGDLGGITNNHYFNSSNQRLYKKNGYANMYLIGDYGTHKWFNAASGTAGNSISFSQAMTLDASGNLLVGKTGTAFGTAGIEARAGGTLWATASGTNAASFNRLSTDGAIAYFNKNGATVGSIGAATSTTMYVSSSSGGGLRFTYTGSDPVIVPCNTTGVDVDGSADLGYSAGRFKDLYLSGGVYLGGTGAANHLDDYEEGVHQTAITMSGSGTVTLSTSFDRFSYTKVGRLVTITGNPRIASVSSPVGSMAMTLPFTAASGQTDECRAGGMCRYYDNSAGAGAYIKPMGWNVQEGTSTFNIDNVHTNGNVVTPAASDEIYFSISYITA